MSIEKQLKKYFSNPIWRRGEDYFYQERVESVENSDSALLYAVRGSGNQRYTVKLSPGLLHGEFQGSCNCPYDDNCKHMVAAILFELDGSRQFEEDAFYPDTDLDWDSEPNHYEASQKHALVELLEKGLSGKPKNIDSDKTYCPCFLLERESSFSFDIKWKIDPYCRYIKKDGSIGGISRFNPSYKILHPNKATELLLNEAINLSDRRLKAAEWLPFCMEKDVELLVKKDYTSRPSHLSKIQIEKFIIEFDPLFSSRKEEVKFLSKIFLKTSNSDDSLHCNPNKSFVIKSGAHCFFLEASNGIIAPLEALGSVELLVIENIFKLQSSWSFDDISDLDRRLEDNHHGSDSSSLIMVQIPPEKIQLTTIDPVIYLYLHGSYHGQVDLRVEYAGREYFILDDITPWKGGDNGNYCSKNNNAEELFLRRILELDLSYISSGSSRGLIQYQDDFEEFLLKFMDQFFSDIENGSVKILIEKRPVVPLKQEDINIEFSSGIDWLNLKLEIAGEEVSMDPRDLLDGVMQSSRGYYILTADMKEDFLKLLFNSKNSQRLIIHRLDIASGEILSKWANNSDIESRQKSDPLKTLLAMKDQVDLLFSRAAEPVTNLFNGVLRNYQMEGLQWLRFLRAIGAGGILGDDMGLGKTIQTIAMIADLRSRGIEKSILIVAPVSTLGNWSREFEKFLPSEKISYHVGQDRPKCLIEEGTIVTSYQTMLRDFEGFRDKDFLLIILDEGQVLKNNRTKIHKAAKQLLSPQKIILSGTPVENSLMDLWSLMDVVNPDMLGNRKVFKGRWILKKGFESVSDYSQLQDQIRPFLLRRTKDEIVSELPEKEEVLVSVSPSDEEVEYYRRREALCRQEVMSFLGGPDPFKANIAILQSLSILRQAAIAPELCGGPKISAKLDSVTEKIREAVDEGHAVLVFSQFVRVLNLLQNRMTDSGLSFSFFDGSFSASKRTKIIDDFNEDKDKQVFLISLKAGGVGINLVKADYVFIIDPWWNPAVESQAIDRSHRIGQVRKVLAYRFIVKNSIEEKVLELNNKKRDMVENLFGSDHSLLSGLVSEDFLELFQDR